jgi:hypothetical protein
MRGNGVRSVSGWNGLLSRWGFAFAIVCIGLLPAAPAAAQDAEAIVTPWLAERSLAVPIWSRIIVCHGYGCTFRTAVALRAQDRVTFAGMLKAKDAAGERHGIARIVQWFDKRVGPETGTSKARGHANGLAGDPSQFDCIDRTTNTASLLVVLSQWKLLKYHRVDAPVSRLGVIFGGAPHSTAVVTELVGGKSWSIDPWPHNSGELPDVTALDKWLAVYR